MHLLWSGVPKKSSVRLVLGGLLTPPCLPRICEATPVLGQLCYPGATGCLLTPLASLQEGAQMKDTGRRGRALFTEQLLPCLLSQQYQLAC